MSAEGARIPGELEDTAEELRSMLPVGVDEAAVWNYVETDPVMTLNHSYDVAISEKMDMNVFSQLQNNMPINVNCGCPDLKHDFRRVIAYAYHYDVQAHTQLRDVPLTVVFR